MRDFANTKNSKIKNRKKKKAIFTKKRGSVNSLSRNIISFILFLSFSLMLISVFYFETEISSFKPKETMNSITIDFPTSLLKDSILIESDLSINNLQCEYFIQIGAYGNKKYALEAKTMLEGIVENISINDVYSSQNPGKLLNSVISGPFENRSAANNAKEKITIEGFEPRLRTICKQ
tara:strand:+ start:1007 stop:1540 length:534 start_codon:yes stop_codon:yes gene_type:complete